MKTSPRLFENVAHPVQGLHVVLERRTVEKPTCATYGGRNRGMPRLPSIDSIIADSSPQM